MGNPMYTTIIVHRHLQQKFNRYREKLDKHKEKGPVFAAAVEELQRKLFPEEVPCTSVDTPSITSNAKE